MLTGICGREGSGKSTISGFLCQPDATRLELNPITNPLNYVISVIFDLDETQSTCDEIYGYTYDEAKSVFLALMKSNIDSRFDIDWLYPPPKFITIQDSTTIEYSFADPLKKIASVVFGIDYDILLGITPNARHLRETTTTKEYNIAGVLTGRKCLEYLGTEVWRMGFDRDIWVKLFKRNVSTYLHTKSVIVPDVRFPNELDAINELGGTLIIVFRKPEDLILTDADKKQHFAKWGFLTFYDNAKKLIKICNDSTIDNLYQTLQTRYVNYGLGDTR
jgi:hypothetical protein